MTSYSIKLADSVALITYCLDAQAYLELQCPHMAFHLAVKGLNTNITAISHDNKIVTNSISCQYSLSYCKNTYKIVCAYNNPCKKISKDVCCIKILSLSVLMEIKKYSQVIDTIMAEKKKNLFAV